MVLVGITSFLVVVIVVVLLGVTAVDSQALTEALPEAKEAEGMAELVPLALLPLLAEAQALLLLLLLTPLALGQALLLPLLLALPLALGLALLLPLLLALPLAELQPEEDTVLLEDPEVEELVLRLRDRLPV